MSMDSADGPSRKERREARAAKAAAELEALRKKQARMSILIVVGVVAAIAAIVAVLVVFSLDRSSDSKVDVQASSSEHGLVVGPDDAEHKVVIYEDFLCPYCGDFEAASRDDLAKLAAEGKVQVDYRPFVLLNQAGPYSELATSAFAVVQEKSGDKVAKEFHDLLFENQPAETGPFPEASELVDLAVEAGAEESEVKDPITKLEGKPWAVAATKAAQNDGVQGTPTVILDGKQFQEGNTVEEYAANLVKKVS